MSRWLTTLVLAAALAGGAGYVLGSQLSPTYEARATLLVGPVSADRQTLVTANELAQTYAELAQSPALLQATARALPPRLRRSALRSDVRATAVRVTRLLTVRVRSGDAVVAARVANGLAGNLVSIGIRGAAPPLAGRLQVLEPAHPRGAKVAPRVGLIASLSALAGLLGAASVLLVLRAGSGRVKDGQDLARLRGVAFLGSVDGLTPHGAGPDPDYELLATRIESLAGARPVRSVLLISAQPERGSADVAARLAAALAARAKQVALVDVDGAHGVTSLLGVGEGEAPAPHGEVLDRLRPSGIAGVEVLPRGAVDQPTLTDPGRAGQVLDLLAGKASLIVLDAEPGGRSPSALAWARAADATLVVAHRGATRQQDVETLVQSLRAVGANVIGTVLRRGGARRGAKASGFKT